MKVVILEYENYRNRTEKRYQNMSRLANRNGLSHVFPGRLFTLEQAISIAKKNGWEVEKSALFMKLYKIFGGYNYESI